MSLTLGLGLAVAAAAFLRPTASPGGQTSGALDAPEVGSLAEAVEVLEAHLGSPRSPWMPVAAGELGQREEPGAGSNPRIVTYDAATTLRATDDAVPWCSAFVNWVFAQLGYARTFSSLARSFLTWGVACPPLFGAVVVFWRGSKTGDEGHVAFLVARHRDGKTVYVLGGNQSDAVSIAGEPTDRVLAYRWPA